jgi:hypothetical protein
MSTKKSAAKKTTRKEYPSYILGVDEKIDPKRIVTEDPEYSEFTKGTEKVSNCESQGLYLNDKGEKCKLYIQGPPQTSWGISVNYPYMHPEDKKKPKYVVGLQIDYPLTSMETIDNPTEKETIFKDNVDELWNAGKALCKKIYSKQPKIVKSGKGIVPNVSINSIATAAKEAEEAGDDEEKQNEAWLAAIKHVYVATYEKDEKNKSTGVVDKTKPLKIYGKLITYPNKELLKKYGGKPEKIPNDVYAISVITRLIGPGDKPLVPWKIIGQRGEVEPCWVFEGYHFGQHGDSGVGASMKFVPKASSGGLPAQRLLGPNKAKPVESDDEKSGNGGSDDEKPKKGVNRVSESHVDDEDENGDGSEKKSSEKDDGSENASAKSETVDEALEDLKKKKAEKPKKEKKSAKKPKSSKEPKKSEKKKSSKKSKSSGSDDE